MSAPCQALRPLLSAYLDGELEGPEQAAVRDHLPGCPGCAAELEGLTRVARRLGALVPSPDAAAWEAFDRELREGLRAVPVPRRPVAPPGWRRWALAGAGVAASLLLAVGLARRLAEPAVVLAEARLPRATLRHRDPRWPARAPTPVPPLSEVQDGDLAPGLLGPAAVAALTSHGLVQVPGGGVSLSALYPLRRRPGQPAPLATADASLLLVGAACSRAAQALEAEVLRPRLRAVLALLARELRELEGRARAGSVRRAARLARERLGVASLLEGVDPLLPAGARARVEAEAARVREARARAPSPLDGVERDYRRFSPRGPAEAGALRGHLQAVRWLSSAGFLLDEDHPDEVRAACLVVLALAHGQLADGAYGIAGQARLEAAAEVLYGAPDELTPTDLLQSLRQALRTPTVRPSDLAGPEALQAVLERAQAEGEALGVDRVRGVDAPHALRVNLLGATRTAEGEVFSRLTAPALPGRYRPTSLDLLALLGSRRARTIVSALGADGPGYDAALRGLAPQAAPWRDPSLPVPVRASLERGRLWAVAALLAGTPAGPAPFQGDPTYRDRLTLAALAALNAPPPARPAPEAPGGAAPGPLGEAPLVEPLPRLHARLAFSARRLARALEEVGRPRGGPLPPALARATRDLERVARLEDALRAASLDLLEGRPQTPATRAALRGYPAAVRSLGPATVTSVEDVYEVQGELDGPGGQRWVLHRVVPRLDRLVVVTLDPVSGRPRLACGAALSAVELWVPGARLRVQDLRGVPLQAPAWASQVEAR